MSLINQTTQASTLTIKTVAIIDVATVAITNSLNSPGSISTNIEVHIVAINGSSTINFMSLRVKHVMQELCLPQVAQPQKPKNIYKQFKATLPYSPTL